MNILLAFTPFVTFAILGRFVGTTMALIVATIVASALVVYGVGIKKESIEILEVGSLILFFGLAIYSGIRGANWSPVAVRLCVDTGLLIIVVLSLLIGKPFTLQYAREKVSPEFWESPRFIRTNYVISGAWAVAFVAIVGFDIIMVFIPTIPLQAGIGMAVVALLGAMRFSSWYPEHAEVARKTS